MKQATLLQLLPQEELSKFGTSLLKGDTPLWKYWGEFVESYLAEGRSEVTVSGVRDALGIVLRHMGLYSIEQCNNRKILYDALHRVQASLNYSNSSLNSYRGKIGTYFRWLEDMAYIESNEVKRVRKSKDEINEQYTLSHEQVQALRLHMVSRRQTKLDRWRNVLFVDLMIFTGARPCELLQLQCRDIVKDGSGYKLIIQGRKQKGRPRPYYLPSHIRDTYEMYVKVRQDLNREESNLFISQSKRTGWTEKGMRGIFKRLSKELGFKVIGYSMRRYTATKLYSEGMSLENIANYLGHTRISTTKRYIERSCFLTEACGAVMAREF
jgi:site-specific recombinase XerD